MKDVRGIITDEIFLSYLTCKHKSFLKLYGQVGSKTDFEKHQNHRHSKFSLQVQSELCSSFGPNDVLSIKMLTKKELARGKPLIFNASISVDNLFCTLEKGMINHPLFYEMSTKKSYLFHSILKSFPS